ncbi:MAG: PAS domain-containing protein, partial [Nitrospira sp.]|nr:PAS domain-containing protein [Nitrospira sp.]
MTKLRDLKTVVKLMLAFGLVGAVVAGVGLLGITTLSSVNDKITVLYERELKGLSAIKDVNLAITGISRLTRATIISVDQTEKEQFVKDIAKLKQQFVDRLSDFRKLLVLAEVKATAAELEQIFPPYMVMMEEAAQLALRGDNVNAIKKVHEAIPGAQQVMSRASALAVMKEKRAEAVYRESNVQYESSRNILIGLSVAGVCLGLLLGWVISRMISHSLADLGRAVVKLEGGNLAARAVVDSKDEIGQLAQSFNKMGEQLEHMVKHQEREIAAKTAEVSGLTDAISRAQAVIEFQLDGTIITANDNFLQCFGYRLDEITGRHHRMFCDPGYANSAEYQAFWAKLSRGEFDAGMYPRRCKNGQEVWVQASYNPILNAEGKVYKIVKYAMDVTAQKLVAIESESILKAIDRGQAMIEFNMDGTVRNANAIILSVLGYRLDEIKGRHHRMFCDPAYASSGEYAAFWQKLNRGEFDAGVYHRLGKGGKDLWLQASYNPIVDAWGKPYKVVKFASDMTGQKQASVDMERLVAEAETILGRVAVSDLTQEMTGVYRGELEKVKASINAVVRNLIQTITTVREVVESVASGSEEINRGNGDLSERTNEQASSLEQTASSMQEMTETVRQNADNAKQANQLALEARETADKGGSVTKQAIAAMEGINKSSKKIADIITVIDEIAFQTNLLALNAAV